MQNVVKNEESLTLKQMFDVTAQTIHKEEEIYCLDKVVYQKNSWTQLSSIHDPVIINLQSSKVYVFSDSVLCLGKVLQHPECNEAWKNRVAGVRAEKSYREKEATNGESTEFEWNIFPGFTTLQLCGKVNDLLSRSGETPETFTGRILFMSMFNDISCDGKQNRRMCGKFQSRLHTCKEVWYLTLVIYWSRFRKEVVFYERRQSTRNLDNLAEKMLTEFAESGCPIFRAPTPLSRGQLKSKGHGKLSIHFAAVQETIKTIFRIIVSVNQLSLYGAVAEMCDEYETLHGGSGRPDDVMVQSIVLSAIRTKVPLESDDPAYQKFLFQQCGERIEKLSQQDRLSKFCMDARFLNVVEIGQYFMTEDTGDLTQFNTVACSEYTREKIQRHNRKDGSKGTPKLGPCWKLQPVTCTENMELRSELCL